LQISELRFFYRITSRLALLARRINKLLFEPCRELLQYNIVLSVTPIHLAFSSTSSCVIARNGVTKQSPQITQPVPNAVRNLTPSAIQKGGHLVILDIFDRRNDKR